MKGKKMKLKDREKTVKLSLLRVRSNWCGVRLGTTEDDSHRTDLTSRWKKWSASKCLASLVENNKQEYEMFDPKKPYTEQGELVNWKC
ncbi:hypothetical protein Y1Q_0010329 [Alligator mississippiensis]|uniref:Uncharacterized protein n=1 Tax=Alligator mississippiensis TaxID=8496 RepID=A0A151NMJ6_ALLMI|nr:hypothetical protein Y1Q_0010329 [Alligator mississippiensis]